MMHVRLNDKEALSSVQDIRYEELRNQINEDGILTKKVQETTHEMCGHIAQVSTQVCESHNSLKAQISEVRFFYYVYI